MGLYASRRKGVCHTCGPNRFQFSHFLSLLLHSQQGSSSCFAIFLPALVMGNFMVLNLFLALLLNSFNSEELKSKKEVNL
jgi:hypothetical protein